MVLLSAIGNLRQFRANQGNGFSSSNALKCIETVASKDCSTSIGGDQIMEIERYFDAFPALGTGSPTSYVACVSLPSEGFSTTAKGRSSAPHSTLPTSKQAVVDVNGYGFTSSRQLNKSYRLPYRTSHYHSVSKSGSVASRKDNHCRKDSHYIENHGKQMHRHSLSKSRKRGSENWKERNLKQCQKSSIAVKEAKPWKSLKPVEHGKPCVTTPSSVIADPTEASKGERCEFISDDLLCAILDDGEPVPTEHVRHLWREKCDRKEDLSSGNAVASDDKDGLTFTPWFFEIPSSVGESVDPPNSDVVESLVPPPPGPAMFQSTNEPESPGSDYSIIEQSLASLRFCEDLTDGGNGSTLLPLFRENPFSHMILHSELDTTEIAKCSIQAFACKHCQETYEIVLESESTDRKKRFLPGVLGLVDFRLDFDWSKYHPPPWATVADDTESPEVSNIKSSYSCDCDFCRHKTWSRICTTCGTPLT